MTKRRFSHVMHPDGLKPDQLQRRTSKPRPRGPVTASELTSDVLTFIAERYADRHLDVETAQLGLSNAAHKLMHLRAVGEKKVTP